MNLPDLKQLKKVIALCRREGVQSIEIDGVKITLSDTLPERPVKMQPLSSRATGAEEKGEASFEELTDEQKLFWSAQVGTGGEGA